MVAGLPLRGTLGGVSQAKDLERDNIVFESAIVIGQCARIHSNDAVIVLARPPRFRSHGLPHWHWAVLDDGLSHGALPGVSNGDGHLVVCRPFSTQQQADPADCGVSLTEVFNDVHLMPSCGLVSFTIGSRRCFVDARAATISTLNNLQNIKWRCSTVIYHSASQDRYLGGFVSPHLLTMAFRGYSWDALGRSASLAEDSWRPHFPRT